MRVSKLSLIRILKEEVVDFRFRSGDEPYEMPQTEGLQDLESNGEPYEEPTTGWAAKEPSKMEQLPDLIKSARLNIQEKTVLAHGLEGMKQSAIARKYNISRSRVHQIMMRAIYKLSKANNIVKLLDR